MAQSKVEVSSNGIELVEIVDAQAINKGIPTRTHSHVG
jgi:hypothetical protein